jgi:peptide/nickel transport system permease protein
LLFGAMLALLVAVAAAAPLLSPGHPTRTAPRDRSLGPSRAHPLGTDPLGRDNLTRVLYGARVSLAVGLIAVLIGSSIGTSLGVLAGYAGGWLDMTISRLIDALLAFPGLVFLIAVSAALGPSLRNSMIAVAIILIPGAARVTRGVTLSAKEFQFVEASRTVGASDARILVFHIVPNIFAPVLVLASIVVGAAVLIEASLGFLGLGVPPPAPSWGNMLSGAGRQFFVMAPWLAIAPGLAIAMLVLAFNLFGDSLRDALDPKLRGR